MIIPSIYQLRSRVKFDLKRELGSSCMTQHSHHILTQNALNRPVFDGDYCLCKLTTDLVKCCKITGIERLDKIESKTRNGMAIATII